MARGKQPRGQCVFCGYVSTRSVLIRHLASCPQRQAQHVSAGETTRKAEMLWHIHVRDADISDFWLDLEVRGSTTLKKLDEYLRAIWLECCGHLSQFSVGGWQGREIAMRRRIDDVFQPDLELTHIYDFGTSSVTMVKAMGARLGVPLSEHPIFLMTRNLMPEAVCMECGKLATYLCMECMMEGDGGMLCEKHALTHPHTDYGEPVEIVNSPRLGMCGYEGPADPPY